MFGLGGKKEQVDVRTMLADAAEDLGGTKLRERALFFFDNRKDFESWPDHSAGEPPWVCDSYQPEAAEVASEILRETLLEDGRAVVVDWADGARDVLDAVDAMLTRAGLPNIDPERRRTLEQKCENLKRGEPVLKLRDPIDAEVSARGLAVHWWNTESDAHIPQLLTPDVLRKWRDVQFGKKFPVLP